MIGKIFRIFIEELEYIWQATLKFNKRYPRISLILKIAFIFGLFWSIAWQRLDPDFGWHLQSGNYFRKFGIPSTDIYTYTARSFPWIDHEWGNDVIISYLYQFGGYVLVAALFGALWTAAIFMNAKKLPFLLLWLAAVATFSYTGIRPTIWTILGLSILIRIAGSKSRYLKVAIPLGFIVWANLQGGFFIGLIYLGYLFVKERNWSWLWIFLLSCVATLVNHYGIHLYTEILRTLTDRQLHSQIKEWSYFYIPLMSGLYILVWGTGFWVYAKKKLDYFISFSLFVFALTLSASRNLPLFVIASITDVKDYFYKTKAIIPKKVNLLRRTLIIFTIYGITAFCTVVTLQTLVHADNKLSSYPVQAVAYLEKNSCPGNLFNSYNFGGYLIWKLPQQRVYIDGRMPSWKDPQGIKYLDRYFNILDNANERNTEFKQYSIRCALVSNDNTNSFFIKSLEENGWKPVVQANGSVLLIAP